LTIIGRQRDADVDARRRGTEMIVTYNIRSSAIADRPARRPVSVDFNIGLYTNNANRLAGRALSEIAAVARFIPLPA